MIFNRKKFIKSIGALSLLTTVNSTKAFSQVAKSEEFNFTSLPYLQNFTTDYITIFSTFNKPCFAWLELIDQKGNIQETIYQTNDGMRNANSDLFKFKVSHKDQNFKYRVVAKEILKFQAYKIEYGKTIQSDIFETKLPLAKGKTIELLILNDIHEYQPSYSDLYKASTLARKDLVILNGDCLHHVDTKEDIIHKLNKPVAAAFGATTPFILNRGNHETRGPFARDFKAYFEYPMDKFYQAFTMGSLYVILLDSGEDKPDNHEVYGGTTDYDGYRSEQKEWLSKMLLSEERKKAKHTVIITHIPWIHSDDWHGTKHNYASFHELANNHKVDAVISGHTHKYGFHVPNKEHNYYVIIGGSPKVGERTFVEITADKTSITLNLKNEDGRLINSFTKN